MWFFKVNKKYGITEPTVGLQKKQEQNLEVDAPKSELTVIF